MEKEAAAERDEYERARQLRDAVDKVKEYGVKVRQLSELKRLAIENEDYETAKKIKGEVEKIRGLIGGMDGRTGVPQEIGRAELRQRVVEGEEKMLRRGSPEKRPVRFEESLKAFELQVKEESKQTASFIGSRNPIIDPPTAPLNSSLAANRSKKYED